MTLATAVSGFLGLAAVLVATGSVLARAADAISATMKLGPVWVGSVLLATATSLPDLSTAISAQQRARTSRQVCRANARREPTIPRELGER